MEEKKGTFSHFAGTIRIVAAVVIAICLIVLFVRWANSRRQVDNSSKSDVKQASQTQNQKTDSKDTTKESQATTGEDRKAASAGSSIPSGIDDTRSGESETSSVPAAGIDSPVLYLVMSSLATYLIVYNQQLRQHSNPNQK